MSENNPWRNYRVSFILLGVAVVLVVWLIWPKTKAPAPSAVTQPVSSTAYSAVSQPANLMLPEKLAQYQGSEPQLVVYLADQGFTETMGLEEYVAGVVAAEMDPSWPQEALAAQAILSRSYTLQKISETGGAPQHNADASTNINEFQAFDSSKINDAVWQAVEETRGLVLVYENNYVHGWFHSDSGGVTATAEEGLGYTQSPTPYITVINDTLREPPENIDSWTAYFPRWQVLNAIANTGANISGLDYISIAATGPSGRVTSFEVNGQNVNAVRLRAALGSTELKSLLLTAEPYLDGDQVVFQGTGYGHGVGMSQYGAKGMAESGKSANEILQYYFQQTEVVQLYA